MNDIHNSEITEAREDAYFLMSDAKTVNENEEEKYDYEIEDEKIWSPSLLSDFIPTEPAPAPAPETMEDSWVQVDAAGSSSVADAVEENAIRFRIVKQRDEEMRLLRERYGAKSVVVKPRVREVSGTLKEVNRLHSEVSSQSIDARDSIDASCTKLDIQVDVRFDELYATLSFIVPSSYPELARSMGDFPQVNVIGCSTALAPRMRSLESLLGLALQRFMLRFRADATQRILRMSVSTSTSEQDEPASSAASASTPMITELSQIAEEWIELGLKEEARKKEEERIRVENKAKIDDVLFGEDAVQFLWVRKDEEEEVTDGEVEAVEQDHELGEDDRIESILFLDPDFARIQADLFTAEDAHDADSLVSNYQATLDEKRVSMSKHAHLHSLQNMAAGVVGSTLSLYDADSFYEYVPIEFKVRIFKHLCKAGKLEPSDLALLLNPAQRTVDLGFVQASGIDVTDKHLAVIAELAPRLLTLNLRKCKLVTDEGIKAISNHCHQLTSLNLTSLTKITDASLEALTKGCPRLVSLSLRGCTGLEGDDPRIFVRLIARCSQMMELNVAHCPGISGNTVIEAIATVNPMRRPLRFLDASGTSSAALRAIVVDPSRRVRRRKVAVAEHGSSPGLNLVRAGKKATVLLPEKLILRDCAWSPTIWPAILKDNPSPILHVKIVDLSRNMSFDEEAFSSLVKNAPNLVELNLRDVANFHGDFFFDTFEASQGQAQGRGRGFVKLARLRRLLMSGCKFAPESEEAGGAYDNEEEKDAELTAIGNGILLACPNLVELEIDRTELNSIDVIRTIQTLDHPLRILHALTTAKPKPNSIITDTHYIKLRELHIGHTSIDSIQLESIVKITPDLAALSLQKCKKIGNEGVSAVFGRCHKLSYLNLYGSDITDSVFIEYDGTLNLHHINLGQCPNLTDVTVLFLAARCPLLEEVLISSLAYGLIENRHFYDDYRPRPKRGVSAECVLELVRSLGPRLVHLALTEHKNLDVSMLLHELASVKASKLKTLEVSSCMTHSGLLELENMDELHERGLSSLEIADVKRCRWNHY